MPPNKNILKHQTNTRRQNDGVIGSDALRVERFDVSRGTTSPFA